MRVVRNVAAVLFMVSLLVSPAASHARAGCEVAPDPWCFHVQNAECGELGSGCYLNQDQGDIEEGTAQITCNAYLSELLDVCSLSVDATPVGCHWFCQLEGASPRN